MKRFSFLAALFGFGGAAHAQVRMHTGDGRLCEYDQSGLREDKCVTLSPSGKQKPKNNECPVCSTMAPAFKPTVASHFGSSACLMTPPSPGDNVLAICKSPTEADLPKKQRTECSWCNTVFVQFAE